MSTQTMTEDTTVFDSDLQAIIDAGRGLATPRPFDASQRFHLIAAPGFEPRVVDLDVARQATAPYPLRKAGKYAVYDAASFVAYVARHATSATELYADPEKLSVLAILDGNGPADPPRGCPGTPGHQTHRCRLVLQSTVAWKKWCGIDHKMLGQTEFAEHVEDRLVDVVDPPAADLLEIAQTLVGTKSADFESTMRLRDGNTTIRFVETTTTKAGQKGQLDVPGTITLALSPFRGADIYRVTARLRTRIEDGGLRLGIVLDRPEDIIEQAFADVVTYIGSEISATPAAPIMGGWPQQ